MTPKCAICTEVVGGDPETPANASLLACINLSYGGTKVVKWMPICENHYNGGPVLLLTPLPTMFTTREEVRR